MENFKSIFTDTPSLATEKGMNLLFSLLDNIPYVVQANSLLPFIVKQIEHNA
jgi:hypothetical protein